MCRDAKGRQVLRRPRPPVYSPPTKEFGMRRDAARPAPKGPQHDHVKVLSQDGKSVSVKHDSQYSSACHSTTMRFVLGMAERNKGRWLGFSWFVWTRAGQSASANSISSFDLCI
jgi:hypothetical protein